jgi:lysophospholipase
MSKLGQLMPTITLPILIMQGSEDRLVNHEGSKLLYAKVGSQDKTLKIYDAFYHEIFNEPDRAKVFADLDAWLESHT